MREAQIRDCVALIIASNDHGTSVAGLDILHKLVSNILKNPTEEKFRVLKTSNKTIQAKLMALKPTEKVLELLEALGYQKMDEDMHAFVGDHFVVLNLGARIIDEESMQIKMLTKTEEDRKKQQLIIDNKKAYMAKAKAEAEHKRIL